MDSSFERRKTEEKETLFGSEVLSSKEEWLTPPEIIHALGPFDIDPCAPIKRPWNMATQHYTIFDDGLAMPWGVRTWKGRVFCNPPYGNKTHLWLKKCADHGNAIVLTFARTETKMFFEYVWNRADAVAFFRGRLHFYHVNGSRGGAAGAPSVLIAYGEYNARALERCGLDVKFIRLKG